MAREERSVLVVLQHSPDDGPGDLLPTLHRASQVRLIRGYAADSSDAIDGLIARRDYDAVLALGGPMGVYDRDRLPFLSDSMRLIGDALQREVPVLGVCLGAQLLAEVLGARVVPGRTRMLNPEVGYLPLELTTAGQDDPVVRLFAPPDPVMLWHQDTHDLPRGAVLLASTPTYEVQAFRVGRRAYGLQFHPEAGAETVESWVATDRGELEAWGIDCERLITDARTYRNVSAARAIALASILARWADESLGQRQRGSSQRVRR